MSVEPSPGPRHVGRAAPLLLAAFAGIAFGVGVLQLRPLSPASAQDAAPPAAPGVVVPAAPMATGNAVVLAGFADLVEQVSPAVVSVRVRALAPQEQQAQAPMIPEDHPLAPFLRQFGAPPETQQQEPFVYGQGSGFFISPDGYLVTNNHVVATAQEVVIAMADGATLPARVIGTDPRTDLALVKVDAEREFTYVRFAETDARVGDWVVAVGNPFGLGGSVTAGIVSALGRDIGAGPYDDFMQLDASINRGNSGGPTFNLAGEVVGVNTAIFSPTGGSVGIGFAIPSYVVAAVIGDLMDDGMVRRGWLGVQIQGVTDEIALALGLGTPRGALVVDAEPETPAAQAGLQSRDVIVAINGTPVEDPRVLSRTIAAFPPGTEVALTVWRDGSEQTINVTLGQLPGDPEVAQAPAPPPEAAPAAEGVGLALAPAAAVGAGDEGVVVVEVDPAGLGADAGLQEGDVIVAVGEQPVATPQEVVDAIAMARNAGQQAVLLKVRAGEMHGLVGLRIAE